MKSIFNIKSISIFIVQFSIFIISILFTIAEVDLEIISRFTFLVMIWNIVSWKRMTGKYFTPYVFLLFAIYVFNFGQILIWDISGFDATLGYIAFTRISYTTLRLAASYAMMGFIAFHLGGILYMLFHKMDRGSIKSGNDIVQLSNLKKLGIILLLISIIPAIVYDYSLISASIAGGYFEARAQEIQSGIWSDMYMLFKASIVFLVVAFHKERKKASFIVWTSILYSTLRMLLFGERGFQIIFILVILWLYHVLIKPFNTNRRSIIKLTIILLAFVVIMTFIADIRVLSYDNIDISTYFKHAIENNPIKKQLIEFGGTILTLGLAIEYIPAFTPYYFGSTYLYSLLTVLPNIGGFLNPVLSNIKTASILQRYYPGALGGSYLAELYMNFSWIGIVGSIIFGLIIAKIDFKSYMAIKNKKFISLINYANLITIVLWLVRSSFSEVPRKVEVIIILPAIIYFFLRNTGGKKAKKQITNYNDTNEKVI